MAPAMWVRPPITVIVRMVTISARSRFSGETTWITCAIGAPAAPPSAALRTKAPNRSSAMFKPSDEAAPRFWRIRW